MLPRRTRWLAYTTGAFGLGLVHQTNFLVPLRARELGASFELIGLIVGAGALLPALASVPMGRVIDRIGARRSYLLGTVVSALLALLLLGVHNPWALLAVHTVLGLPRTLGWIASQNYITGLGRDEDRAAFTGRFSFFTNVGIMVGPLLAGIVSQVAGLRLAFGLVAAYAAVFAVSGLFLPRGKVATPAVTRQGAGFRTALQLMKLRGIQVALILTFVRLWNEYVWSAFYPLHLVDGGIATAVVGTVVFAKGLVATLLAPTVGFWCKLTSKENVVAVGLGCAALGLVVSPHVDSLPLAYVAAALVGIGAGVSLPMLLGIVSEAAPPQQRGVALGLRMSVNQTAGGVAPLLMGPLVAAVGTVLAFAAGGVVAVTLLAAALALARRAPSPLQGQMSSPDEMGLK